MGGRSKKGSTPSGSSAPHFSTSQEEGEGSEGDEPLGGTLAPGPATSAAVSQPVSHADANAAFESDMRGFMLNQQRLTEALQAKLTETVFKTGRGQRSERVAGCWAVRARAHPLSLGVWHFTLRFV